MRSCRILSRIASHFILPLVFASTAHADWTGNGVVLCDAANDQQFPVIASDGAGGAIVVWQDFRNGDSSDLYAQRISATGVPLWGADGVPVCTAAENQTSVVVRPDGAGGALVVWDEARQGFFEVYAQRVSSDGAPQWTPDGVWLRLVRGSENQCPNLVPDGAGGAIIAMEDREIVGGALVVYAQRVDVSGVIQWGDQGLALRTTGSGDRLGGIIADGVGGAIISWGSYPSIYAQRVSMAGELLWTSSGVRLGSISDALVPSVIASDGAGGAIVAWSDYRDGSDRIYAQRVTSAGVAQWAADGVPLCTAGSFQDDPEIVADGSGGAIVAFWDTRSSLVAEDAWRIQQTAPPVTGHIWAQRVNANGVAVWNPAGVPVCAASGGQDGPVPVTDGANGTIIAWTDSRNGTHEVYAQRLNSAGTSQWAIDGILLCTASGAESDHSAVSNGAGGVIVAWDDSRGPDLDVYAALVQGDGTVPTLASLVSATASSDHVQLTWFVHADPDLVVTIYRSTGGGGWAAVRTAWQDGTNRIVFEDRDVVAGQHYGYRLGIQDDGVERYFGEVWVDTPLVLTIGLQGVRPNPSPGDLIVAFTLPAEAPAALEVMDVAGRRVLTQAVGAMGVGTHQLRLGDGKPLPAGVYLVTLTQRDRAVSTKAVVLH